MRRVPQTLVILLLSGATAAPLSAQILGTSEREEIRVGRQAAARVEDRLPVLRRGPWPAYIEDLGQELARRSSRPELPYRFRIIDLSDVNAFALPGGYIYVYRGLLRLVENEAEIAGVLAHEIAHASERHHVEQSQKMAGLSVGLGVLDALFGRRRSGLEQLGMVGAQFASLGAAARFSRDAERDADRKGVQMMRRAGLNPDAMISLFVRMDRLGRRQPGAFEGFFASHPSLEDRRDNVDEQLERSDRNLARTSPEFERLPPI